MGEAGRLERLFEAALPALGDVDRLEAEARAAERIAVVRGNAVLFGGAPGQRPALVRT
jgi:hypothetical protein